MKLERKHALVLLAVAVWNVVTYAQFTKALVQTKEDCAKQCERRGQGGPASEHQKVARGYPLRKHCHKGGSTRRLPLVFHLPIPETCVSSTEKCTVHDARDGRGVPSAVV